MRKISEAQKLKNIAKTANTKKMHEWLQKLWDDMPKKKFCQSCGKPIWGECLSVYFDHLLERQLYPEYSMDVWNIFFVCGDCHGLKGNGFPTEIHQEAIEEALEIHKKKQNCL